MGDRSKRLRELFEARKERKLTASEENEVLWLERQLGQNFLPFMEIPQ